MNEKPQIPQGILDRQAVDNFRRLERIKEGREVEGSEKTLVEMERSAMSVARKAQEYRDELTKNGNLTEQGIQSKVDFDLGVQWEKDRRQFEETLVALEGSIELADPVLPERTDSHREVSQFFRTLTGDKREEALSRALSGKDPLLAEALATEPPSMSSLTDISRQMLIKRIQPQGFEQIAVRSKKIRAHIEAARDTLRDANRVVNGQMQIINNEVRYKS